MDSGKWKGKQIVPEQWVRASITPDAPHVMSGKRDNALLKDGYGFQIDEKEFLYRFSLEIKKNVITKSFNLNRLKLVADCLED